MGPESAQSELRVERYTCFSGGCHGIRKWKMSYEFFLALISLFSKRNDSLTMIYIPPSKQLLMTHARCLLSKMSSNYAIITKLPSCWFLPNILLFQLTFGLFY